MTAVEAGGHWLDTGDGPVRIDPPVGRGAETPVTVAYRAYVEHRQRCAACAATALGCPTAGELWDAYTGSQSAE